MNDPYAELTRDELVAAGLLESEDYRDFPGEERCFDAEAFDEMCREDMMGYT